MTTRVWVERGSLWETGPMEGLQQRLKRSIFIPEGWVCTLPSFTELYLCSECFSVYTFYFKMIKIIYTIKEK